MLTTRFSDVCRLCRPAALALAAGGIAFIWFQTAGAQTLTTLYTFTGDPDGKIPMGGVVFGANGALYGTTFEGGYYDEGFGGGTVFELVAPGRHQTAWTENILVNYYGETEGQNCSQPIIGNDGVAGFGPQSAPTFDPSGNLYAAASQSGCDEGTVVELTPGNGGFSIASVLQFQLNQDSLGNTPADWGGLIFDSSGNVYGTTLGGGTNNAGEVFELDAGLPSNTVNLLANFVTGNADGNGPQTGLVAGPDGVLYGTTSGTFNGGANSTVFQLNPDGSIVVLHTFEASTGIDPGPIVLHGTALYGTTQNGGTIDGGSGQGVVYELKSSARGWKYMVLHTFGDGTDGAHPFSIAFGKGGSIIGNATDGGASSAGMMFQLNKPVSHGDPWTETALWNFSGTGSDGAQPIGNLAVGKKGAIYGTTEGGGGGPANYGTVFELTP